MQDRLVGERACNALQLTDSVVGLPLSIHGLGEQHVGLCRIGICCEHGLEFGHRTVELPAPEAALSEDIMQFQIVRVILTRSL